MIIGATDGQIVDHRDKDRCNNLLSNLELSDYSKNAQNRTKASGTKSKFIGVYPEGTGFVVRCASGKLCDGWYKDEIHAAYAYNLLALQKFPGTTNLNPVDKPIDFVPWVKKQKKTDLPKGISLTGRNTYKVGYKGKQIGQSRFYEQALAMLDAAKKQDEEASGKLLEEHLAKQIQRNEKGEAIIIASQRGKNPITVIVDDDKWHELSLIKWHKCSSKNYIGGLVKGQRVQMHRYLMNCKDPKLIVDHINNDIHDNRVQNLRIVDASGNSQNAKLKKVSKSGLRGVTKRRNKFLAHVSYLGKSFTIASYNSPEEAAYCYDQFVLTVHGIGAAINNVQMPQNFQFGAQYHKCLKIALQLKEDRKSR